MLLLCVTHARLYFCLAAVSLSPVTLFWQCNAMDMPHRMVLLLLSNGKESLKTGNNSGKDLLETGSGKELLISAMATAEG